MQYYNIKMTLMFYLGGWIVQMIYNLTNNSKWMNNVYSKLKDIINL